MKKILLIALIAISLQSNAQVHIGIGLQNKGIHGSIGGLIKNTIDLQAQVKSPLTSIMNPTVEPQIFSFTAGLFISLLEKEEGPWAITPQVGIGLRKYRTEDFNKIYNDEKLVLGIELSKDSHNASFFGFARHCEIMYYGLGIKYRFKNK